MRGIINTKRLEEEEKESKEKEVGGGAEKTQSKQTELLFLIMPKYVNILHIISIYHTSPNYYRHNNDQNTR